MVVATNTKTTEEPRKRETSIPVLFKLDELLNSLRTIQCELTENFTLVSYSYILCYIAVPPNILLPPASVKEKLGFRVTLNCTVRGFPLPSLVWKKDNVNLIGSEEDGITEEKDEGIIQVSTSLTINEAKREDTGVYICKANNTVASTSKSANLTVLGKLF